MKSEKNKPEVIEKFIQQLLDNGARISAPLSLHSQKKSNAGCKGHGETFRRAI